jgi:hypothetical protein
MGRWTMSEIRACNARHGHHWFERGTMRFFDSQVGRSVYQGPGGVFFMSSEKYSESMPRKFSVRKFNPRDCSVDTIGPFGGYPSSVQAAAEAKRLARGGR